MESVWRSTRPRLGGSFGVPSSGFWPARAAVGPHGEEIEEVADMHHALRVVEGVSVDGQAGMAGGAEEVEQVAETGLDGDGDDVGARHHHVVHPDAVEAEDVLQHRPFLRREVLILDHVRQRVFQVVADGIAGFQAEAGEEPLIPALASAVRIRIEPDRALVATSIVIHLEKFQRAAGPVTLPSHDTDRRCRGGERLHLQTFHDFRLRLKRVIVPEEVKEAVDEEMGEMVVEELALFLRLARHGLEGDRDIAQGPRSPVRPVAPVPGRRERSWACPCRASRG